MKVIGNLVTTAIAAPMGAACNPCSEACPKLAENPSTQTPNY
ncbi:hypothetical protein [Leptodesmis sp.]